MRILSSTLRTALFRTCRTIVRDDPEMDDQDLQQQWQKTGLRDADYRAVIADLQQVDLLRVSARAARTYVTLTARGLSACDGRDLPVLSQWRDWLTLEQAQWRIRTRRLPRLRLRRRRTGEAAGPNGTGRRPSP